MQNVVLHQGSFSSFLSCLILLCSIHTAWKRHPECTKTHHFQIKNQKNFWGGSTTPPQTPPPVGKGTPPPHSPLPQRLDSARAFGARTAPPNFKTVVAPLLTGVSSHICVKLRSEHPSSLSYFFSFLLRDCADCSLTTGLCRRAMSVRPSISCPSRSCIVSKRVNLFSIFFTV